MGFVLLLRSAEVKARSPSTRPISRARPAADSPAALRALAAVAERVPGDTALLHLGGVQFPVTGPVRYTMTARDAVELCRLLRPRTIVPIHYEGWKHFRQGRDAIEREFAGAPEDVSGRVRWFPIGEPVALG